MTRQQLDHAEEINLVIFPAADQSAEIVQPSKEAFDFPAAAVSTQFASVLGALPAAVVFMRGNESDAMDVPKMLVERIAVVGAVSDHSLGCGSREKLPNRGFDERGFMRRSAGDVQAIGRPWRSAIAMILLPFPRRVGPIAAPFSPN